MDRSDFRIWFEDWLRPLTGRRVQWPHLFRCLIRDEINRIREDGTPYQGPDVIIDRDQLAMEHANHPGVDREDILVYRLYREAHEKANGVLELEREPIWLLTCKVPNQGRHRHRAADLLGIRADGSLVVFECKVEANRSDTPLLGLLEGLDYLGHLMIDENFAAVQRGFLSWKEKHPSPTGFENTELNLNGFHSVIVLAPADYYKFHRKDAAGIDQDWELLSDRHWPNSTCAVRIDFATTQFDVRPSSLLALESAGGLSAL